MEKGNFDGDGGGQGKLAPNSTAYDTKTSMEIKILAEVEKIWINYDLDQNGTLEFNEVETYLQQRCPHIPKDMMKQTT